MAKQATPVYRDKILHLFDVEEGIGKSNNDMQQHGYKIVFPIKRMDESYSLENNKCLEFRLYDHSGKKIRRYLLGHFLLPIDKIQTFSSMEQFLAQNATTGGIGVFKNYDINETVTGENPYIEPLHSCWNELKYRNDKVSKQFVHEHQYGMEKYNHHS